ncbi:sigma-70 family RNA polymerase sigma factor [Cellulophaga sp. E16_2]|uniref:RNA polymerase sigma factor n=1 Tax=Cellulophaga sp. E16_2 TaxID=2789297 RepID=UPI001A92282C|nr:sigma-70 family RNA polymerase sigma factor [Cellulophaga sp. E16_2]MBO0592473.1 sigma-70 family RNA polymerase sigma factor [Cellulophaga sp. E16_2]
MKTNEKFQSLTDEELVEQIVKTKNTLLFAELYDRFSGVVYNKCHSFTKRDEEAQDLTQDVFLKLYIKLSSFKGNSKFTTWLYAFTYNYCVNYVTRDTSKKIEQNSRPIEENENLLIEADDFNLFQLKVDRLKICMELIAPEDKMILLLKYQDDASIKDIATSLELGESAIKMRLKRAKVKLIQIYNEHN